MVSLSETHVVIRRALSVSDLAPRRSEHLDQDPSSQRRSTHEK